jgi:hypothetical protein
MELRSLIHSKLICKLEWDSDIPRSIVYKRKFSVDIKVTGPVELIPQVTFNMGGDGVVKKHKVLDEKGTSRIYRFWVIFSTTTQQTKCPAIIYCSTTGCDGKMLKLESAPITVYSHRNTMHSH